MSGALVFALATGMAAALNPCGFALLPAYLTLFIGMDEQRSRSAAVRRAIEVSIALTTGFVVVFGVVGLILTPLSISLHTYLPWATVVIGIALVGLGFYLLAGKELVLRIPKLNKGGSDGTFLSMFLFGASYAIASLSCTIGLFIAATTARLNDPNFFEGVLVFVTYGLGMGLFVALLTVAVALAKTGLVNHVRKVVPIINRIAGGVLILAGAYVAYYGWWETLTPQEQSDDPIVGRAQEIRTWLINLLPDNPVPFAIGIGMVLAVTVAATGAYKRRRNRNSDETAMPDGSGSSEDALPAATPVPPPGASGPSELAGRQS